MVGVNSFTETAPSPLAQSDAGAASSRSTAEWKASNVARSNDGARCVTTPRSTRTRTSCAATAASTENLVPATIEFARVGGTVGEWANALREVFGVYRGPTGVGGVPTRAGVDLQAVREEIRAIVEGTGGRPIRLLVGKPGLDGHSNGAEQIAVAARDAGMEVVYQGIRLSPAEIAAAARDEDVDVVGLSILSGSHLAVVPECLAALRAAGVARARRGRWHHP